MPTYPGIRFMIDLLEAAYLGRPPFLTSGLVDHATQRRCARYPRQARTDARGEVLVRRPLPVNIRADDRAEDETLK
jgi:hypothetical protein